MEKTIAEIITLSQNCDCGNSHNLIPIEKIIVGNGALAKAGSFIEKKSYKNAVLIADEKTFQAAGGELSRYLTNAKIDFSICLIQPDESNDVVADELSLVQALLEIPQEAEVLIAIGSGTLHDITRFCSSKTGVPFISVPTAPSVDGFTSMGSPLIVRGEKKTFQMTSPIAVFADLSILMKAPKKMIAAGFGDMIAKFTSLADWKFGHLVAGEPYCPLAAQITREALDSCIVNADKIAASDEEGIRILIEGLIKSGLAMLLFGQSHPASGGEHHLSHYWEMEFLRQKRSMVLHGAKVAVSTPLLADLYKKELLEIITDSKKLAELFNTGNDVEIIKNIQEHVEEIIAIYTAVPDSSKIRELVAMTGGETNPEQLGITNDLVLRSLNEAHHLRNRFTALKFLNEVVKINHRNLSGKS